MCASFVSLQASNFGFWAAKREPTGWTLQNAHVLTKPLVNTCQTLRYWGRDIYLSMFVPFFFFIVIEIV
jgi:hypothetical protein